VQDGIVGAEVVGAGVVGAGVVEAGVDEIRFGRAGVVDAGVNETTGGIDEVRFERAGADEAGFFSVFVVVGLAVLFHWHALTSRFTLHSGRAANFL
jgi:hypothetical protein